MFRQTLAIAALAASVSMAADLAVESQLKDLNRFLNEADTQGNEEVQNDQGETQHEEGEDDRELARKKRGGSGGGGAGEALGAAAEAIPAEAWPWVIGGVVVVGGIGAAIYFMAG